MFVAEGHKLVEDLLPAFECTYLAAAGGWLQAHENVAKELLEKGVEIQEATSEDLQKASLLKHPQDVLAIFRQRTEHAFPALLPQSSLCLALDGVQDPGNVGTLTPRKHFQIFVLSSTDKL